jgi:hypothetical protein
MCFEQIKVRVRVRRTKVSRGRRRIRLQIVPHLRRWTDGRRPIGVVAREKRLRTLIIFRKPLNVGLIGRKIFPHVRKRVGIVHVR